MYARNLQLLRRGEWAARSTHYLLTHRKERDLIARNDEFRDIHRGDRCFIIGNGPSLIEEDLGSLAAETLFTVNNLQAAKVGAPTPRYHVISDRRFFSVDPDLPEDREMYETLWSIMAGADAPISFMPSSEHGFIDNVSAGRDKNIRYFCNPLYFSEYYQFSVDLTRVIPRFSSVVQHAILIAAFMGFRRIYLLGCDTTNIVANVNTALVKSAKDSYACEVSGDLDVWLQRQFAKRTMERCAESYLEVLIGFRFLNDFCRSHGIELVNCSSRSVIDSIPRARLGAIL